MNLTIIIELDLESRPYYVLRRYICMYLYVYIQVEVYYVHCKYIYIYTCC